MEIIKISVIVLFIVYGIILLVLSAKSGKFLSSILISSGFGVVLFLILRILSPYTGFYLSVNLYNVGVSAVLGVPGVISLMILNLII